MAEEEIGHAGLWTTVIGALLIFIDGIAVLATNRFYSFIYYGGVTVVGWAEIILSIIMWIILYYYKQSPKAIGWTEFILALIALPFDGGFWTLGAWIALIGGILIAYKK